MSMDLCRPFLSSAPGEGSNLGGGSGISSGPTHFNRSCMMMNLTNETSYNYNVAGVGEPVDARKKLMQQQQKQQQPFDVINLSVSKSPEMASAGAAAATKGKGFFPFTNAQWKELERQAMVFKYMMHSIPVPCELLLPIISSRNLSNPQGMRCDSHLLMFLKNGDPEPGRCRRTDGKKWRCSNSVALDQKYCEKHVHRGRPRSRKHVETASDLTKNLNKKSCLAHHQPKSTSPVSVPNPTLPPQKTTPNLAPDHLPRSTAMYTNSPFQLPSSDNASIPSLFPQSHLRDLDVSEDQWHQLSSYPNTNPFQEQSSLNSFNLFLNPDMKKPSLVDAWTENGNNITSNSDLISLGLSMGHGYSDDGENESKQLQPQIGNWLLTQSGGPLGEVIRCTNSPTENSCSNKKSPTSSSPIRVRQKAVASLSDSASHSPEAKSVGLQWLNQDKLLKQTST